MASLSRRPNSTVLLLVITAALASHAAAAESGDSQHPSTSAGVLPLSYVASNGRLAVSVDQDGGIGGEFLGVLGNDGKSAFLTQGWLSAGGAGGLQFDYHWLRSAHGDAGAASVLKVFGAVDQNPDKDRKATLGAGFERTAVALDLYYSRAITHERLISQGRNSFTETLSRTIDGRAFRQDVTTHTLTELFEHPYEHGVGLRVSRFFEPALWRLRAGLDYERGEALLQEGSADQLAFMAGVEKYFSASGHSVALEVEHFRKNGAFEGAAFAGERDGVRASVFWRYEFGRPFRPAKSYRTVAVRREVKLDTVPAVTRHEAQLSAQALFELDSAILRDTAADELLPLLDRLKHTRVGPVEIVGHTCDLGSDAYNQSLSERRAAAVRDWLIARGVDPTALQARGEGELQPRHPNDSERGRARNRRIEVRFTSFAETVVASGPAAGTITEWVREEVPQPRAWIERALRTPAFHKRAVDVYQVRRVTQSRTEGPLVPVNAAPVAADDAAQTTRNSPLTIDVLANDSDGDGDALTISALTDPARGSASITAAGRIAYAPDADFVGTDTFTYTVQDGEGGAASATVTVTVTAPPNQPPIARDDDIDVFETSITIAVLANDSDPDGDALFVISTGAALWGTVAINQDGTVTYTRTMEDNGSDAFTYTIGDGRGGTSTATVSLTLSTP